jgi:hypothetical protein
MTSPRPRVGPSEGEDVAHDIIGSWVELVPVAPGEQDMAALDLDGFIEEGQLADPSRRDSPQLFRPSPAALCPP